MGLGSLIAGIGSMVASGAASAVKNKTNNNKTSSSSSNKGSSGSSGGSIGGSNSSYGGSSGFKGSAEEYDRLQDQAKQYAQQWHEAQSAEDKGRLHELATGINNQLGKTYDDSTGVWSGGYARPTVAKEDQSMSERTDYGDIYNDTFDKYYGDDAAKKQQEAIEAANKAAVDKNVLDMEAQKGKVSQAGEAGNRAAQEAYMQTINPNGGLAESLAARGLLSSGLTESSQIAAGNAYQDALNNNKTTVTEQLAEIERAIANAKLSGDLATAEQLQAWYNNVANAAMQNANNIVSANQWQQQFDYNKGVTDAGMTGFYNGAPTLAYKTFQEEQKRLAKELAAGQITQEQFDQQFQAQLEQMLAATEGQKYQNKYYAQYV